MTDTILDIDFIRTRQLALGVRTTDMIAALGTFGSIPSLLSGDNANTMTVAAVANLANLLGVPPWRLFTAPTGPTQPTPPDADDIATLGAALGTIHGRRIRVDRLTHTLGWTTAQLNDTAAQLNDQLAPLGHQLIRFGGYIRIAPAPLARDLTAQLVARERRAERGLNYTQLAALLDIAENGFWTVTADNRQLILADLRNLGLIEGARPTLTQRAREAFLFDELPDVPHHNLPPLITRTKSQNRYPKRPPRRPPPADTKANAKGKGSP